MDGWMAGGERGGSALFTYAVWPGGGIHSRVTSQSYSH